MVGRQRQHHVGWAGVEATCSLLGLDGPGQAEHVGEHHAVGKLGARVDVVDLTPTLADGSEGNHHVEINLHGVVDIVHKGVDISHAALVEGQDGQGTAAAAVRLVLGAEELSGAVVEAGRGHHHVGPSSKHGLENGLTNRALAAARHQHGLVLEAQPLAADGGQGIQVHLGHVLVVVPLANLLLADVQGGQLAAGLRQLLEHGHEHGTGLWAQGGSLQHVGKTLSLCLCLSTNGAGGDLVNVALWAHGLAVLELAVLRDLHMRGLVLDLADVAGGLSVLDGGHVDAQQLSGLLAVVSLAEVVVEHFKQAGGDPVENELPLGPQLLEFVGGNGFRQGGCLKHQLHEVLTGPVPVAVVLAGHLGAEPALGAVHIELTVLGKELRLVGLEGCSKPGLLLCKLVPGTGVDAQVCLHALDVIFEHAALLSLVGLVLTTAGKVHTSGHEPAHGGTTGTTSTQGHTVSSGIGGSHGVQPGLSLGLGGQAGRRLHGQTVQDGTVLALSTKAVLGPKVGLCCRHAEASRQLGCSQAASQAPGDLARVGIGGDGVGQSIKRKLGGVGGCLEAITKFGLDVTKQLVLKGGLAPNKRLDGGRGRHISNALLDTEGNEHTQELDG
eukprot:comp24323_c0_seq1/m.45834 comp24323_c0_seq1/g.45834  ORF comp24323_c0_seq1/g.45834 comp24323_c0_seq1/m.45834 type:complete len:612 (+) comp24323_c0_seq1:3670-5505(+)